MSGMYADNDGRFPDESEVLTPFPLTDADRTGPRDEWPWVWGWVRGQCGPDEWDIVMEGAPPVEFEDGDPDKPLFACVFRNGCEVRKRFTPPLPSGQQTSDAGSR